MDNESHKNTWNNFTKFVLWGSIAVVVVLTITAPINWVLWEYLLDKGALVWISDDFIDMNPIQRHQLVYAVLSEELKGDLHALSLSLMTSGEVDEYHTGEKND